MANALKVETQIRFDMCCECICRRQHNCGARMAAATTHRLCGKNCWKKEAKVSVQAPVDRQHLSLSMDFGGRFSWPQKFQDSNSGSGDKKSDSTSCSNQWETDVIVSMQNGTHAYAVCCCFSGRVHFASFPAQSEFTGFVSCFLCPQSFFVM